jgi:hypothetical protein
MRHAYKALIEEPDGKGAKHTWLERLIIKTVVKEIGWMSVGWIQLAQDRAQ